MNLSSFGHFSQIVLIKSKIGVSISHNFMLTYLNMSTEFAHLYLASKCFCEHKIGFSKNNGIMCEKNGGLERHTYCTDDEWCIGATDKIEATYHVESLCVKGNY